MGNTILPVDPSDPEGTWLCWDDENCGGSPVRSTDKEPPSHCPHKDQHRIGFETVIKEKRNGNDNAENR